MHKPTRLGSSLGSSLMGKSTCISKQFVFAAGRQDWLLCANTICSKTPFSPLNASGARHRLETMRAVQNRGSQSCSCFRPSSTTCNGFVRRCRTCKLRGYIGSRVVLQHGSASKRDSRRHTARASRPQVPRCRQYCTSRTSQFGVEAIALSDSTSCCVAFLKFMHSRPKHTDMHLLLLCDQVCMCRSIIAMEHAHQQ